MNKLTTVLLAGALVTILFYIVKLAFTIEPPTEVQGAATTVVLALVAHFLDRDGDGNVG